MFYLALLQTENLILQGYSCPQANKHEFTCCSAPMHAVLLSFFPVHILLQFLLVIASQRSLRQADYNVRKRSVIVRAQQYEFFLDSKQIKWTRSNIKDQYVAGLN